MPCRFSSTKSRARCVDTVLFMFSGLSLLLICSVAVVLSNCGQRPSPLPVADMAPSQPDIVVIVLDALRADHVGAYGHHRNTTPFIDQLASQSVMFTQALSASSYTGESIASLFTGKLPSSNPYGSGWYARPSPDDPTMAQLLQAAGYRTGLFCDTPVLGPHFYDGFDEAACMVPDFTFSGTGPLVVDRALEFIKKNSDTPFYLYLHFLDPHAPYAPPNEYYLRFADSVMESPLRLFEDVRPNVSALVADGFGPGDPRFDDMLLRYDAEIAFVDDCIRRLVTEIKAQKGSDNLVVVITSDHGEEFLDNHFVEHAWRLYWESIHIPLIIWAPGRLAPAQEHSPVSLMDLMPTLLTFSGAPFAADAVDGRSLIAPLRNKCYRITPHGEPIISELLLQTRPILRSIIHNNYQYLAAWLWCDPGQCSEFAGRQFAWRDGLKSGAIESVDVWGPVVREEVIVAPERGGAIENKLAEHPGEAETFRAVLETLKNRVPKQVEDAVKLQTYQLGSSENASPSIEEETRLQLETLGYL